jgi:16S rRNA (guanine966-N2)-methyltransferase
MLHSMWTLNGVSVLDLFCGSGAMGLEALSRGAGSVTFVDNDVLALDAVEENARTTGLKEKTFRCVKGDLPSWLRPKNRCDIAFCDPPYAFSSWVDLMGRLDARSAFLESSDPLPMLPTWEVVKVRRYGGTLVTVVERADADDDEIKGVGRA